MPRKKKAEQPIGVGLTAKQMKRKKPINADMMRDIEPLTDNQKALFDAYAKDQNLVAYGVAGTGKTFITLYNALKDVLDPFPELLFTPGDADSLAKKVENLIMVNKDKKNIYRGHILDKYHINIEVNAHEKIYKDLLKINTTV